MHTEPWNTLRKLYAAGILVYFAAAGALAMSITDFSEWVSFMGRHAAYAFAWPVAAAVQISSWQGAGGAQTWMR